MGTAAAAAAAIRSIVLMLLEGNPVCRSDQPSFSKKEIIYPERAVVLPVLT
jgi:hypothetical protein